MSEKDWNNIRKLQSAIFDVFEETTAFSPIGEEVWVYSISTLDARNAELIETFIEGYTKGI